MALRVEWDPKTRTVIRIENDDEADDPMSQRSGYTGADRSGEDTRWYPLEIDYPETFVPRFKQLLGPATMKLRDGVVHQEFPEADFSEAAVRGAITEEVNRAAWVALNDTDWQITRKIETGQEPDDGVLEQRTAIREAAAKRRQAVADASPSELLDFEPTVTVNGRTWTSRG